MFFCNDVHGNLSRLKFKISSVDFVFIVVFMLASVSVIVLVFGRIFAIITIGSIGNFIASVLCSIWG